MVLRHGRWLWPYQGRSMHWIIGALDVSWTCIGRNLSPMTRYAPALGSHFCQTLFAAVVSSVLYWTSLPSRPRTGSSPSSPGLHSGPAWRTHEGLVVQGNPGSEPWKLTCDLWILDWRLQSDTLRTDRLGGNLWQRLRRLRHAPEETESGDTV